LEGRKFDVTLNSNNTITVDPDHLEDDASEEENIETLMNGALDSDNFEIRPHWTLDTLFPNGEGFPVSTEFFSPSGIIQAREARSVGINIPASIGYIYLDASDDSFDGWYLSGLIGNVVAGNREDDRILRSEDFYVLRNNTNTAFNLNVVGDVPTTDTVNLITSNLVEQDNHVSLAFPIELTLSESNLFESGAFNASTRLVGPDGDILQVYDLYCKQFRIPHYSG